jgi:cytochrome c2
VFRIIRRILTGLGLFGLVAMLTVAGLVYTGVFTVDKLRLLVKYNPLATRTAPVETETAIQATLLRLKLKSYAIPAMGEGIVSGAGAIQPIPGGMLIAERSGRFHFFDERGSTPKLTETAISIDINQEAFETHAAAEGYAIKPGRNVGYAGLGMRLHDLLLLRDGKRLAATHTRWDDAEKCVKLHLVIADFEAGDVPKAGPWNRLFSSTPCMLLSGIKRKPFAGHQAGGRMVEMADGRILLTVGDFKNDGVKRKLSTADPSNSYGKFHLIDPVSGAAEVFSTGHRNAQGLVITGEGEIWSTEHGPTGGDEVNLVKRGVNYGWPVATYGRDCRECAWQQQGRHDGYPLPVLSYVPSIGISNLVELQDFAPQWDGDLLVSSLKQETLHRLHIREGRVVVDEPIRLGDRLRDMQMLADGRVALWTDTGKLMFLTADLAPSQSAVLAAKLSADAQDTIEQCRACHDLDPGIAGPDRISLWGVHGREKASLPGGQYSDALKAAGGRWDNVALDAFLAAPAVAVPGTSMAYEGIRDAALRQTIIDYLKALQ